ncbi:ribokinase [Bifidobacterium lemurum]|uniref:Ribokinase n=1 Tax=Bifidobacterium lemurum TaxID=1603886 RepID=A0A261FS24_9BIFI|nr:PfkB family carbohydrate kinase [Bifidobacterium lemurum]OZG61949.1 ribokinase [Bifidobacterium lemurum]QOL35272.1 LacI family DNA-binding transcriptional regulator [Bifidobacterium lemurum]
MNIKDIAHIAGVSPSTVSKIVNGKDQSISPETREKVLRIVREYHYAPYSSTPKTTKSWSIGVLLRSSISFDTTLDGIVQTAQASGYGTMVFNSYSDAEQEMKNIAALGKHRVDGVIWEPAAPDSLSRRDSIDRLDIPALTIGPHGGDESLLLPYTEAAYRLTEELIMRGHKGIACLLTRGRRTEDFLAGFKRCLFDHGMPFDDAMVFYELDDTLVGGISGHTTTGVVSSHYRMALEFHQLMGSLHYSLPDDVSLVSIRNDTNETLAYPGSTEISTYTIRNADFGSYLCAKLITAIERSDEPPHSFVQEFHLDNTSTLSAPSSMNRKKITVVGSLHIDNCLSVPKLPTEGSTVTAALSSVAPGGKGINQAVGVAKLGHRVSLIGNVGSDPDADFIFREMSRWGIDASGITRRAQSKTGTAFIFVDANGDSMISLMPGANDTLSPQDIADKDQLFENTGYCLVQSEIPLAAVEAACRAAHRHHASTILKPSNCDHLPHEVLAEVDILVPSENELNALIDGDGTISDKARALIDGGAGCVIVTLGERGCTLFSADAERHFPAADFTPVDNTGAGDAFISALASYLMYGRTLEESIEVATVAAGYSITREGATTSLIDRSALEARLLNMDL